MPMRLLDGVMHRAATGIMGVVVHYLGGLAWITGGSILTVKAATSAVAQVGVPGGNPLNFQPNVGTILGAVTTICGMIMMLAPKFFEDRRDARQAKLEEIKLANAEKMRQQDEKIRDQDSKMRLMSAELEAARRATSVIRAQVDENTKTGKATAAVAAGLGGAYAGTVQALQDSSTLDIPVARKPIDSTDWPSLLLVEDDPYTAAAMAKLLAYSNFRVAVAATVAAALKALDDNPSIVVLDLKLPDGSGLAILEAARTRGIKARIIVTAGSRDPDVVSYMNSLKPDHVFFKPVDLDDLLAAVTGKAS